MRPEPFANIKAPTEEQYLFCIRCGLCLSVCPTYRAHLKETESPRGRVMMARKVLEGELDLSPNFKKQMQKCMVCQACNVICPVGIKPADLALDMRYVAEQIEPTGWKERLFGGLLRSPRQMEWGTLPLRLYQNLGLRWLADKLRLTHLLPAQLRDLEQQLPPVPARPFRSRVPEVTPARGEQKRRIGFFLGCAQNLLLAEESQATVRVLARNGSEVITPRALQCCGMPAIGYGRQDIMLDMARHNIALFEEWDVDMVVTDCATCGSTLKEYGHYLAEDPDWAERAAAFSERVRDISEFLVEIPLEKPQGRVEARVTYHDPCHLVRAQGVAAQPRQLLQMIEGVEFVEMNEADWCCGSAGSQLISNYEDSLLILEKKIDNVVATGADYVASGCPGCQMQLTTGLKSRQEKIQVVHPISLLDQAYGKDED